MRKFVVLTVCLILLGLNVHAAVITTSATDPVVGIEDIAQLGTCGGSESLNVSTNDQYTYVADDRTTQGQTFTTIGAGRMIGFSLRNPTYWGWTNVNDGDSFTVRVSSVSGTALTELRREIATVAAGNAIGYNQGGTGKWLHITLASPVVLAANTIYAFDITSFGPCIEIDGQAAGPYAGGSAYTTGETTASKLAAALGVVHSGDRTFIVEMEPAIRPDVPAPGAANVDINQDLSWTVLDPSATKIDLYFGTTNDPNLSLIPGNKKLDMAPATTTTWDPGTLAYSTTYYWKVDAYEPNGLNYIKRQGNVNSFTTVSQSAFVSPVSLARTVGALGSDIVLTVTAANTTRYQWYKVGTPDVVLSNGTKYSGVNTTALTIKNLQDADQGSYYCQVDNDLPGTDPVNSVPGLVMIQRLMSYYPFEVITDAGTITPDTVSGFNMTLKNENLTGLASLGTDVAVAGLGTYSLVFANSGTSTDGQYGQLPTDVAKYEDITISLWVKWNNGNQWQRIFDFGADSNNNMFLTPYSGDSTLRFALKIGGGAEQQLNSSMLKFSEWTHVAVTLNGNTGRMYVNGVLVNTNTGLTNNPIDLPQTANYVGKSQYGDPKFNGLIDDLKIYNYARSSAEVGQDYANTKGVWVCNLEGTANMAHDLNKDCNVDTQDLLLLASEWLNSNRIYQQP
jgi:hypothetical protein